MPSHPARSAATLAAVASLAVAPAGHVASSLATSALAPGAGATLTSARVAPHPVEPTVATYPVRGISRAGLSALGRTDAKGLAPSVAALSAPEPASGVAVTGATWRGAAPPGLRLAIRTETRGRWSPWAPVPYDADHGPTPGSAEVRTAAPGTDPFVVGGSAAGRLGAPVGGWKGWGGQSLITPVGDWNGDGLPDVMARAPGGRVYLYPGRGMSGFKAPVIMRSSLPGATAVVAAGRCDGDGAPDVLVATARGHLQLYRGNGPGGLEDPVVVAHGVDRYNTLVGVGVGDLTGDGQPDLVGRTDGGDVWLLPGLAPSPGHRGGSLDVRQYLGSGWSAFRIA